MRKIITRLLCMVIMLSLSACSSKQFIYLEDMPLDMALPITNKQQTLIKPGDRLAIHIGCTKQELAVPFNSVSYNVSPDGQTSSSDTYAPKGYLVDEEGKIDFPVLGRVQASGLPLKLFSEHLKGLLVDGHHVPDAVVQTEISNFTIYGLGALAPGKLVVPDGKINILQAVSQMGDLEGRAKYEKVRVIREEDGERMEYDLDLTTTAVFDSPAFYLHQNDIVYAEPRKRSKNATGTAMTLLSILATLASIAFSISYIVK